MENELSILNLPSAVISRISRFLNLRDVFSLAHSCSYVHSVMSQDGPLWARHCKRVWACEELCANTWFDCWLQFCRQYGRYRSCFARIKTTWRQIEQVIRVCEPAVVISPVSEKLLLDELEEKLAVQLPCHYSCYVH